MMRVVLSFLLFALSFVSGCVSVHTLNYDEEISPTSNLAEACSYQWPGTIRVLGRDRSLVHTTSWDDNAGLGNSINGDSIKREIEIRCGGTSSTPGGEATVTVYYLTNVNKVSRTGVTVPSILLSVFTLGLSPAYSAGSVALCLDIALPDGRHRYGLSEGSIVDIENYPGYEQDLKNGAPAHVALQDFERQREMLGNLLLRALHKAWIPGQGNLAQPNCEAALNSIIE
jgi:hypothetical protein